MSDTTPRDQLGLTISAYRRNSEVAWEEDLMLADHLLEQGWRPPARVIHTAEELDELPHRTIVCDRFGIAAQLDIVTSGDPGLPERWWSNTYGAYPTGDVDLPATVIYEPKEDQTDE